MFIVCEKSFVTSRKSLEMATKTHLRYFVIVATFIMFLLFTASTWKNSEGIWSHPTKEVVTQESLKNAEGIRSSPTNEVVTQESWKSPSFPIPIHIQSLDQDDSALAEYIRNNWILPPSTLPRVLKHPEKEHYSQMGQSTRVDKMLKGRRNGFFIETGAYDGEGFSNSLFFEKSRGWSGILIEPNKHFENLRSKHRHVYITPCGVSTGRKPQQVTFREANFISGVEGVMEEKHKRRIQREFGKTETHEVQLFPITAILNALQVKHVDFFSLDIEGGEAEIVQTMDLDAITVDLFVIEHNGFKENFEKMNKYLVGKYNYILAYKNDIDAFYRRRT